MKHAIYWLAFVSLALSAICVQAQQSPEEVTSNPSNAVMADDFGTGINEAMEEYLARDSGGDRRGWRLGMHDDNPGGGYIGWGEAMIQTDPSDVQYGRARIAAYSTAYINAMGDFARTMSNRIAVETFSSSFANEASLEELETERTDSLMRALADRASTLSVAALDKGLEMLGQDPGEIPRYSRSEKVLLAEELLQREIVRRTAARLRGVRTLATFEDRGNIGVLILHHPRLERMADRILHGAAASPESSGVDSVLQSIDSLSAEELIFQHGLRVIPDDDGNPVLVAFGQSSPAVSADESQRRIRMAVSQSRQVAESQADAAIAEFLDSSIFAESVASLSASEFQVAESVGRSMVRSEGAGFFEDLNNMIRQSARAEITGVTTVRRWQANHPDTGHLYIGHVRMWTPSQSFEYDTGARIAAMREAAEAEREDEGAGDADAAETDRESPVRQSRDVFEDDG